MNVFYSVIQWLSLVVLGDNKCSYGTKSELSLLLFLIPCQLFNDLSLKTYHFKWDALQEI
jgi:hypothetical protein